MFIHGDHVLHGAGSVRVRTCLSNSFLAISNFARFRHHGLLIPLSAPPNSYRAVAQGDCLLALRPLLFRRVISANDKPVPPPPNPSNTPCYAKFEALFLTTMTTTRTEAVRQSD